MIELSRFVEGFLGVKCYCPENFKDLVVKCEGVGVMRKVKIEGEAEKAESGDYEIVDVCE